MASINKIVGIFPHPIITPIIGKPTYETICPVHLFLNANAASVQSHLGNGRLGLLFLTVLPAVFNNFSQIQFVPPPNPGPDASIPPGATAVQISTLRHSHTVVSRLYKEYDTTEKNSKQLLIGAVDIMFFAAMRPPHWFCQRHHPPAPHLFVRYIRQDQRSRPGIQ